jgi:hypothetical protein
LYDSEGRTPIVAVFVNSTGFALCGSSTSASSAALAAVAIAADGAAHMLARRHTSGIRVGLPSSRHCRLNRPRLAEPLDEWHRANRKSVEKFVTWIG